jgi:ribosomal protein S7
LNPVTESKQILIEAGFTEEQALNLIHAIVADSPEKLWEIAPKWLDHVAETKRYMTMIEMVADGYIQVSEKKSEWLFKLRDEARVEGL